MKNIFETTARAVKAAFVFMLFAAFLPAAAEAQCVGAPQDVTFTAGAGAGTASISWSPATVSGDPSQCPIGGYFVQVRVMGGSWPGDAANNHFPSGVTATSVGGSVKTVFISNKAFTLESTGVEISGLTAETTYQMRVAVLNSETAAPSPWSAVLELTTAPATVVAAPTIDRTEHLSANGTSVTLHFTKSTTAGAVHNARYRRSDADGSGAGTDPGDWLKLDGIPVSGCDADADNCGTRLLDANTSVMVTGLTENREYDFSVGAFAGNGFAWSAIATATPQALAEVADFAAAAKDMTSDTITLTWTNSSTTGAAHYVRWRLPSAFVLGRPLPGPWHSSDGEDEADCQQVSSTNCGGDQSANNGGLDIAGLNTNTVYEFEVVSVVGGVAEAIGEVSAKTHDTGTDLTDLQISGIPSIVNAYGNDRTQTFYSATVGSSFASTTITAFGITGRPVQIGSGTTAAEAETNAGNIIATLTSATAKVTIADAAVTYIAIIITAQDNVSTQTYRLAITKLAASADTVITALQIRGTSGSNPVLRPTFDGAAVTEYGVAMDRLSADGSHTLTFLPTLPAGATAAGATGPNNAGALTLSSSGAAGITNNVVVVNGRALGVVEYVLTVTAADTTTTQDYVFSLIIGPDLSAIAINNATPGGFADVVFLNNPTREVTSVHRAKLDYTAGTNTGETSVQHHISSVEIKYTWSMDGESASVGIRGDTAAAAAVTDSTGATGNIINLAVGTNIIDLTFTKTGNAKIDTVYSITIIREANTGPEVSFAEISRSVAEDIGEITLTVNVSPAATADISVVFTAEGATLTDDYTITASPLSIAAGETSAEITIGVVNDTAAEPEKTLSLALFAGRGYGLASDNVYTLTITDNQPPGAITAVGQPSTDTGFILAGWDIPAGTVGANSYEARYRVKSPLGKWVMKRGADLNDTAANASCTDAASFVTLQSDCRFAQLDGLNGPGVEYEFQIRAFNANGNGAWSALTTQANNGTKAAALTAPTLTAAADESGVTLNWTPPAGTVDDYRVRYRNVDATAWQGWIDAADLANSPVIGDDASGNGFSIAQNTADYTLIGLGGGMTFDVGVAAVNAEVVGAFADGVVVTAANATLSALAVAGGMLDPAFNAAVLGYVLNVPFATTMVTLTPAAQTMNASINVNGNAATAAVNVDITAIAEITVSVAAAGFTTQIYRLGINIEPRKQGDVNADGELNDADGILIARYIFGMRGGDLTDAITTAGAAEIESRMQTETAAGSFDVDNDTANLTTAADAILIARYFLGVRDAGLTDGQVNSQDVTAAITNLEKLINDAAAQ